MGTHDHAVHSVATDIPYFCSIPVVHLQLCPQFRKAFILTRLDQGTVTILGDCVTQQSALRHKHFNTYKGASSHATTTPRSQHGLALPCNTSLPLEAPQPRAVQAGAGEDLGTEGCSSRNRHTSIAQGLAITKKYFRQLWSSKALSHGQKQLHSPTEHPGLSMCCCCSGGTPAPFLQLLLQPRPGEERHVHIRFILCRLTRAQAAAASAA